MSNWIGRMLRQEAVPVGNMCFGVPRVQGSNFAEVMAATCLGVSIDEGRNAKVVVEWSGPPGCYRVGRGRMCVEEMNGPNASKDVRGAPWWNGQLRTMKSRR
jgi:hypothetical protein